MTRFRTESGRRRRPTAGSTLASVDGQQVADVDEVIVVTGFRPDFGFLSEVRLDLDPALGAARVLADADPPRPPQLRRRRTRTATASSPSPSRASTWSA